jgi:hypothetical protein
MKVSSDTQSLQDVEFMLKVVRMQSETQSCLTKLMLQLNHASSTVSNNNIVAEIKAYYSHKPHSEGDFHFAPMRAGSCAE